MSPPGARVAQRTELYTSSASSNTLRGNARRAARISDMGNDDTLVYSNIRGEDDNAP
jgi:hypothetical protein